ncbi:glycosyltransferase [Methylobacterium radiotolerans]|uniref:glycosyltransferase n=1 Tax=Methylobacterium radiotolerans TaxID=31998 RepID=UPI001F2C64CB|nr:glycosyltransferase [Methylobacterium radiotolerans]UIY43204.1 glycosyltransferase family 2 protein [Methylobacterium radiotolerans]
MSFDVTLCLTAGGRPDLLQQTLESLLPQNGRFFKQILITNDRGDSSTDEVVQRLAPTARLFSHKEPIGQHPSIDEMYRHVETAYIFHCEDDWYFDPVPFIPVMLSAVIELPNISSVSARQTHSLQAHDGRMRKFGPTVAVDGGFARRPGEPFWTGHSFNPSMLRTALWREVGPFSKYADEERVNNAVEATGKMRAFLVPGVYFHIGDGRHMPNVR